MSAGRTKADLPPVDARPPGAGVAVCRSVLVS